MQTSLNRLRSKHYKPASGHTPTVTPAPPAFPSSSRPPPLLRHRRYSSCVDSLPSTCHSSVQTTARSNPTKLMSSYKQRLMVPLKAQEELLENLFRQQNLEEEEDFKALCRDLRQ